MYKDYIIFDIEKIQGAAEPERSAGGGSMKEAEWNKLTEEQQAIIKEVCELIRDDNLQEILAEQLAQERELLPHIKAELKKSKKDPEYNNISVYDVLDAQTEQRGRRLDTAAGAPSMETTPKSKALLILEKALRRQALHNKYPAQPHYDIKSISVNNSTLLNYLQDKPIIGAGAFDLPVMPKKDITTYTMIEFDDASGKYEGIKNITEIERSVLDRIYTLKKYANTHKMPCIIDGYIIASCMPGAAGKVTQQEANYYNEIIEKYRNLKLYIDATDELREKGIEIPEGDTFILDDFCISTLSGKYRTRTGEIKPCYLLRDIPLPHFYAEQTGQIITISADLFDIKETISDKNGKIKLLDTNIRLTRTRQDIVTYMLRRIYIMKNDFQKAKEAYRKHEAKRKRQTEENKSVDDYKPINEFCRMRHIIDFNTLFEKSGVVDPSKTEAARLRDFCKDALTFWQAKGIIKGFEIKTGKGANIKIILGA